MPNFRKEHTSNDLLEDETSTNIVRNQTGHEYERAPGNTVINYNSSDDNNSAVEQMLHSSQSVEKNEEANEFDGRSADGEDQGQSTSEFTVHGQHWGGNVQSTRIFNRLEQLETRSDQNTTLMTNRVQHNSYGRPMASYSRHLIMDVRQQSFYRKQQDSLPYIQEPWNKAQIGRSSGSLLLAQETEDVWRNMRTISSSWTHNELLSSQTSSESLKCHTGYSPRKR